MVLRLRSYGTLAALVTLTALNATPTWAQSSNELRDYDIVGSVDLRGPGYVDPFFHDPFFRSIPDLCEWFYENSLNQNHKIKALRLAPGTALQYSSGTQIQCEALNGSVFVVLARVVSRESPEFGKFVVGLSRDLDTSKDCALKGLGPHC